MSIRSALSSYQDECWFASLEAGFPFVKDQIECLSDFNPGDMNDPILSSFYTNFVGRVEQVRELCKILILTNIIIMPVLFLSVCLPGSVWLGLSVCFCLALALTLSCLCLSDYLSVSVSLYLALSLSLSLSLSPTFLCSPLSTLCSIYLCINCFINRPSEFKGPCTQKSLT